MVNLLKSVGSLPRFACQRQSISKSGAAVMEASVSVERNQGMGMVKPPTFRSACCCSQMGKALRDWK